LIEQLLIQTSNDTVLAAATKEKKELLCIVPQLLNALVKLCQVFTVYVELVVPQ
jgi:anthranilate/para-aminobenzoate synthase component I